MRQSLKLWLRGSPFADARRSNEGFVIHHVNQTSWIKQTKSYNSELTEFYYSSCLVSP